MIHYACIVTQLSKVDVKKKKIDKRSRCSIEQLNPTSTNGVFCNTHKASIVRVRANYIDLLGWLVAL